MKILQASVYTSDRRAMSTAAEPNGTTMTEPIPGYRLQERIGAGGYGEVWRADAPGGIAKAVKIVFGRHEDERAVRELAALNRIKEVRHPFLLSLERIELVDGQLVIVTELATSSLKDLFAEYRQSGQAGIPRSDLLAHLQDAADALDYISQQYSLQHLDVKPENLLLVGGRIKVADFGLVKDLHDPSNSIVGGLTPTYAAPELFDGRPNQRSDQYSLAIVYHEMLTGALPYEGRTMAQLAAQHLHSAPRLDRLPASDQPTIARAMSKDPQQRFSGCRDMIESLLDATPNLGTRAARVAVRPGVPYAPPAPTPTDVLPAEGFQACAAESGAAQPAAAPPEPRALPPRELPPLEIRPEEIEYRPTVFIGIGGLAARTLQMLQRRLADRFGDVHAVPALQMLVIESDPESLTAVTEGDRPAALGNDSAVFLPLGQPADYRRNSAERLQWLSRRWIYNIPRSSQTQSFRPLGRLALVDHLDRVLDRLTRAVQTAVAGESLAASAQQTGLPFRAGPPRIFIVASISGGTGSGMALDVAYVARKVLRDLGLPEDGMCGILAHCAGRSSQVRDLAVANSYAFLTELHYYSDRQHGYPGDAGCGLPAFAPEDAPFAHAYVVHLGEDLEGEGFTAAADTLAQYLYAGAVTAAGTFFDRCRAPAASGDCSAEADPLVRTFGLCQAGFSGHDIPAAAADELCKSLVTRWRGLDRLETDDRPASLADPTQMLAAQGAGSLGNEQLQAEVTAEAESCGLILEIMAAQLRAAAADELGNDPDSYLRAVLGELLGARTPDGVFAKCLPSGQEILDALDTLIRVEDQTAGGQVCLQSALEARLQEATNRHAAALREWILGLVASPKYRVGGAQRAADYAAEHLRVLGRQATEPLKAVLGELRSLRLALLEDPRGARGWAQFRGLWHRRRLVVDRRLSRYFQWKIEQVTLNAACRLSGLILAQVAMLGDKLRNVTADLHRLAEEFARNVPAAACGSPAGDPAQGVRQAAQETINSHKPELMAEMEAALEDDLRRAVAADVSDLHRALGGALRSTARSAILRLFKKASQQEMQPPGTGAAGEPIFSLVTALEAAVPRLPPCGGARRLLVLAPASLPAEQLATRLGDQTLPIPTVVADADNTLMVCYEVEQLPLRRVAAALLDGRPQYREVAARLHTRIDVPWLPL
ncbi:MAG: tubulin-like doman-containing protein [Thermoguttaceae bacterium]